MCNLTVIFCILVTILVLCEAELRRPRCEEVCIYTKHSRAAMIQCIKDTCWGSSQKRSSEENGPDTDAVSKKSSLRGGLLSGGFLAQKSAICASHCGGKHETDRDIFICERLGCTVA